MSLLKIFALPILLLFLSSCMKGEQVDLIIHNAVVHTMTDSDPKADAIAIRDGKIVEVGPERQILNKYRAEEIINAQNRDIYPGWTDAHGHILNYARLKLSVNLIGCQSYDEMIVRIDKYQSRHNRKFVIGRGWDQSLWGGDELPNNKKLNELFPDMPVCLFRIDGHALLANDYLIKRSNVFKELEKDPELSSGGYFLKDQSGNPSGVFVDNAMEPILRVLSDFPEKELSEAILEVQDELLTYGITGIHEAGLTQKELQLLKKLSDKGVFLIDLYGMLLPEQANLSFIEKEGIYKHKNIFIRSMKVYGDGALGSRGACLKADYTDHSGHKGYLTSSIRKMERLASFCLKHGYQMNTHAIGDSANKVVLDLYKQAFEFNPDHRWRIEHAQIVDPNDQELFASYGVFPSVQPTHATSDQRWAEARIGKKRMDGAYPYKSLLNRFGMLAIGTDFPVEYIDPFATIHAAVQRKNSSNYPDLGFRKNESITLEECIRGMTIWAAYASFQENELGTIEAGKRATLSIFDKPVRSLSQFEPNFAYLVFINGKKVYSAE